jgi:rhamnose transport system permease protein
VIAVAVLGTLQTALTADLIPAQDQNIVVGALLLASVIVPNAGDIYRRARVRLRSAEARRHRSAAAQAEGP